MRHVALLLIVASMGCITGRVEKKDNSHPEVDATGKPTGRMLADSQTTYHFSAVEGFETVANADALLSCAETLNAMRAENPMMMDDITCRQGMLHRDQSGMWGYTYPNGQYMMLQPRQLQYFGLQNGYGNRYGGPQLGPTGDASTTLPQNGGGSSVVYGRRRKLYTYPTDRFAVNESLAPKPLAVRDGTGAGQKKSEQATATASATADTGTKLTAEQKAAITAAKLRASMCDLQEKPDHKTIFSQDCVKARTNWDKILKTLRALYRNDQDLEAAIHGDSGSALAMQGDSAGNGFATPALAIPAN